MEIARAGLPHDITRTPLSYRGNGIVPRIKADAAEGFSPKSVINDSRIISPASSSSGSMERRIGTDKQSKRQPRHDRGYSISDGESDSDTYPDSSRELAKVGVSGHLESLPETHSLALEAFKPSGPEAAAEEASIGYGQLDSSSSADEGRRPLLPTKYKETYSGQNFSLHSFDKELLQTTSRGGKSTAIDTPAEPLAMERNHDEKFVISGGNPQPELSNSYGYASPGYVKSANPAQVEPHKFFSRPNGTVGNRIHANRTSPPRHDENSGINHTGQLRPIPSHLWIDSADVRSNGFSPHTTTNPHGNGGGKQQEVTRWQRPGAPTHRPAETSEVILTPESRDSKCREPPFLQGGWSPENGVADKSDEARRRQAGQGPYSGSMGIFAYPGTPQRSFPSLPGNHVGSPAGGGAPVVTGSPGYERGGISQITAQASGGRVQQRPASGPSLKPKVPKPPPSKWDDADKWIASPSHNDTLATPNFRLAQGLIPGPVAQPGKRNAVAGQGMRGFYGVGSPEYANQNGELLSSPNNNGQANEGMIRNQHQQLVNPAPAKALTFSDLLSKFELPRTGANHTATSDLLSRFESKNQTDDIPVSSHLIDKSGRHDITGANVSGVVPPELVPENGKPESERNAAPSDSPDKGHRDMATQMTPFPSLRNSTCRTPWLNTSPTRHNTPARSDRRAVSLGEMNGSDVLELQSYHLEKLEHRILGCEGQATLDRNSNWSTREEEEEESAKSLRQNDIGEAKKAMLMARAAAWEEAEHAKFIARFHREEARIQAWEALETARAQAQTRKIEVKLERKRADASKKMSIKLASARQKAEEMRVAAEALRDEQAAKTSQRAQQIRQSADLSSPLGSCFTCCFVP